MMVILSIAIGVFAVGTMLTARDLLHRGVDDSFDAANPASAVVMTEPFGPEVVEAARALPGVGDAEGRARLAVRVQVDADSWMDLDLYASASYADIRIDRVLPDEGAWPPATGEVAIERLSRDSAKAEIGSQLVIETADGVQHSLHMSGIAYDPGQVDPNLGEGRLSGYISLETLAALGEPVAFTELHIQAADDPRSLEQGERVAALVRDQVLVPNGITVHRIAVHDTPRYHSTQLGDAILMILGLMGVLTLVLGGFLVVNTVSALLAQQVRQIGMMKAIGGRRRQIAGMYLALVFAFGLIAVAIAIPLAAVTAWAMTSILARMLNIDLSGPWLPPSVIAIELAIGLAVPLLASIVPVIRGTKITVREAMTSYGLSERPLPRRLLSRAGRRLSQFSRPITLSLRNTFRRRGRLAMTLATLTIGGAVFASVATIQSSLDETYNEVMQYWSYDVEVSLQESIPASGAISQAQAVPGVEHAEGWIATSASRTRADGTQNSNIWLISPPADTDLVRPTLIEGRWLQPGEGEALVVNVDFRSDEPDIHVGDIASLHVEGHELRWPVVGVVSTQLMGPVVYAPYESLSQAVGLSGEVNQIVLVTDGAREEVALQAEQQLRSGGVPVVQVETQDEMRSGTRSIFNVLVGLLFLIAALLVVVGSIGLMGAMSLNVIERRREIGVMRAIGASNRTIARIVVAEGLIVGLLSWVLSAVLALPLSWGLSHVIGVAFVQVPLSFTFSIIGLLIWLLLVIVLSVLASLLPARGAWRVSVREALAYE
jgi:putative ABC transport system permease protein